MKSTKQKTSRTRGRSPTRHEDEDRSSTTGQYLNNIPNCQIIFKRPVQPLPKEIQTACMTIPAMAPTNAKRIVTSALQPPGCPLEQPRQATKKKEKGNKKKLSEEQQQQQQQQKEKFQKEKRQKQKRASKQSQDEEVSKDLSNEPVPACHQIHNHINRSSGSQLPTPVSSFLNCQPAEEKTCNRPDTPMTLDSSKSGSGTGSGNGNGSSTGSGSKSGSCDDSQPTTYADNTTTTKQSDTQSVPPPVVPGNSFDLIVQVGTHEFFHSSAVIAYASDYLRQRMVKKQGDGNNSFYFIDFSYHSPADWKIVTEFLQPRSIRRTAELTFSTIPIVLPWFRLLDLSVLLEDVDAFMLETIVLAVHKPPKNNRQTIGSGEYEEFSRPTRQYPGNVLGSDNCMSIGDLLVWTTISYSCNLINCKTQARQWLRKKLLEPIVDAKDHIRSSSHRRQRNGANNNDYSSSEDEEADEIDSFTGSSPHDEQAADDAMHWEEEGGYQVLIWELEDLKILTKCLHMFDELRGYLWDIAIVPYLPQDLNVEDSVALVANPLFPYLLREGMVQLLFDQSLQDALLSHPGLLNNTNESTNASMSLASASTCTSSTFSSASFTSFSAESSGRHILNRLSPKLLHVWLASMADHLKNFQEQEIKQREKDQPPINNKEPTKDEPNPTSRTKKREERFRRERSLSLSRMKASTGAKMSPPRTRREEYATAAEEKKEDTPADNVKVEDEAQGQSLSQSRHRTFAC